MTPGDAPGFLAHALRVVFDLIEGGRTIDRIEFSQLEPTWKSPVPLPDGRAPQPMTLSLLERCLWKGEAALIDDCRRRDYETIRGGHRETEASSQLARKLGYRRERAYPFWQPGRTA